MDLVAVAGDRLLVQRTVSWQRVASSDKEFTALCWSPDGTLLALALSEGGYVLYDLELGMTDEEESFVHQELGKLKVKALFWAHVGRPHPGWALTDDEKERELEWRYRSAYLDRSKVFLPPTTHVRGDGEQEDIASKSNPTCKKPLSILCAATIDDEVHLYVHGRYFVAKLACNSLEQMVCSADLAHVAVLQSPSKLSIYSLPALSRHRYSLQTISSLYSSIQRHMKTIREGVPNVLSSWKNVLRPLDTKLESLQKVLKNYGIETTVSSALSQYIAIGKSSEYANALEQFFTSVQMNDQLLIRMEKTLHNGLAGVEAVARAALFGAAQSLVFDANELCGLDDYLLPRTLDLRLQTRHLLFSVEFLLSQIVEARFRLRDLCAWLRSAASEIKAIGTPPDSVQRDNAKKRRVPQQLLHRVADYVQQEPYLHEGQSATEGIICCCVSALMSGKTSHVPRPNAQPHSPQSVKTSLFEPEGVRTVVSVLGQAQEAIVECFEQPRAFIQQGVSSVDIILPSTDAATVTCAVHPRIGVEVPSSDDGTLLDGAFYPSTTSEDGSFSCSRQWTIFARSCILNNGHHGIQLISVPVASGNAWILSRCLVIPANFLIKEVGFYGDDGNSNRFPGTDKEEGKEGRQALGLLLEDGSNQELWLVQYDKVTFDVTPTSRDGDVVDVRSLEIAVEAMVHILPQLDNTMDEDESDPDVIYAKTRCVQTNVEDVVESRLLLCGSRGVGGVVTANVNHTNYLALFDLEEDEEGDEDNEMEEA